MVGIIDDCQIKFPVGTRIKIGDSAGTVKYVGEVTGQTGIWLGIEWDNPQRGKHNGSIDGKHYFQTLHPTSGSFIRPGKVGPFESLEDAVRERYLTTDSNNILDQQLMHDAQRTLQASIFEIVGMEKIARKQSKFEQLVDIGLDNSCVNTAGYLKDFINLSSLDLSNTLVCNWETIADIAKQVPTLISLNLSCNRFQLPTEVQIIDLEPSFRNLQYINLRNCGFNDWAQVMQSARLWPNILSLGLQENPFSLLTEVNCNQIFKNLRELDLHRTRVMDFDQVCKLGNIKTLVLLNLMENGIEQIKLPDCEPNEKLDIFISLEQLELLCNPIWNQIDAFNELDKLPKLKHLNVTPHLKSDFNEMFSDAVATITNLEFISKIHITTAERRGAEYDIWKKYAVEWLQANKSPESLREFYKKHRSYANIVKKYGSPAEFVQGTHVKISKLIKIRIQNKCTGEIWEKKVPRMISVQTLQGLIMKHFHLEKDTMPILSCASEKYPELVIPLENSSRSLDFYSVQENDVITVTW